MLCHSVFFTLRDRSDAAKKALVAGCHERLTGHPGTVAFHVGTVSHYDRQVNDRDFDVALHIVFESHAAHDAYQSDPRHTAFIAEHSTTWAKVRVFDADLC